MGDIQSSEWGDVDAAGQVADRGGEGSRAPRSGPASASSSRRRRSRTSRVPPPRPRPEHACGRSWRAWSASRSAAGCVHVNAGLFLQDEVYRPHDQRDFLSYGLALRVAGDTRGSRAPRRGGGAGGRRPSRGPRCAPRLGRACASAGAACGGTRRRGGAWPDADGTWGADDWASPGPLRKPGRLDPRAGRSRSRRAPTRPARRGCPSCCWRRAPS